jgi:5,6-dimethylbenzimidazole synthase
MSDENGFSASERHGVYRAIHERRDIRSGFLPEPLDDATLYRLLEAAHHAPSVGFMQPWRFIVVRERAVRDAVYENFARANAAAAGRYTGDRAALYGSLKLEGLREAPQHVCVTHDAQTERGGGLGRATIPATALYSTVCAVQNLWLAARAEDVGVGWVSILDVDGLRAVLRIPPHVTPVAYLCLGRVAAFPAGPVLEQRGWEHRVPLHEAIAFDRYDVRAATSERAEPSR